MDDRLIFLYHLVTVTSEGGTQEDKKSVPMDVHAQAVSESDRQIRLTRITSCDGEGNFSTEVSDSTLPRKASSQDTGACTANRHR